MSSKLIEIAKAINAAIDAHDFGVAFTPERSYGDFDMQLDITQPFRVDVVVVGHQEAELLTRGTLRFVPAIDIGVRYKFGPDDTLEDGGIDLDKIDEKVELVENIYTFLATKRQDDSPWRGARFRSTIVHKHLKDWRQFTGIIRAEFNATVALT